MLFWLYAPLLAIYMRKFAYLCIMVWIHMDAHEYISFFSKFEYFMYILIDRFFGPVFWSGFFLVLVRFTFLGSTDLVTSPVLITLGSSPPRGQMMKGLAFSIVPFSYDVDVVG